MAVPYDHVSRLTPQEIAQMRSWSFLGSYGNHRIELIDLARVNYTAACHALNALPTQDQVYLLYWRSLKWANVFKQIVGGELKGNLPPSTYGYYAGLLARYVLEQDWGDVSSAPCP